MKYIFCSTLVLLLLVSYTQMDAFASQLESTTKISQRAWRERNKPLMSLVQSVVPTVVKKSRQNRYFNSENGLVTKEKTVQNESQKHWISLFDGKTMADWTVPVYGGDGNVEVQDGNIVIGRGEMMTGIRYEKDFPKINYEIRYEVRRTNGYDFFGACTFPIKESFCTLINGGWGGGLTGLSSVDGYDASENSTSTHHDYLDNTWYRFRIRVTDTNIQVWITSQDKEENWGTEQSVIELEMEGRNFSTRFEVDKYKPLGFCTWTTEGQLRNIEYRKIETPDR